MRCAMRQVMRNAMGAIRWALCDGRDAMAAMQWTLGYALGHALSYAISYALGYVLGNALGYAPGDAQCGGRWAMGARR